MAYDPIIDGDIAVGKPTKRGLWQKVKGNFDFLFGQSNPEGLLNGSFEYDVDGDGIPDNWTRTLLAGGSSGLDTTNPQHGAKCLYFTHPGGAGNGGGYADSDYIECSELENYYLEFTIKSSAAGIHNLVEIYFYNKSKGYISTGTAHNANSPDTVAHYYTYQFTPPANARYFKVRVLGGQTDVNQAGTVYFDGVRYGLAVSTARILDANVTLAKLKFTQGSFTTATSSDFYFSLNAYSHYPALYKAIGSYWGQLFQETQQYVGTSGDKYEALLRTQVGNSESISVRWHYHSD